MEKSLKVKKIMTQNLPINKILFIIACIALSPNLLFASIEFCSMKTISHQIDTTIKVDTFYSSVREDTLLSHRYFVNGKLVLDEDYFSNGQIQSRQPYNEKGEIHGTVKEWYKNGKLKYVANKVNDTISGKVKKFYKSGEIMYYGFIIDNKGIVTEFYKNGNKKASYLMSGKRAFVGPYISYYKEGTGIKYVTNYGSDKNKREYIKFYKNGNKNKFGYIMNGNKKHGKWKIYNRKGGLKKIKYYNKGALEKEKTIDNN